MASTITKSIMKPVTLGIAGGTGAGKTTLAQAIFKELGGSKNVVYLTHDHYYKDLSHKSMEERSKTNFDHPDSLDTNLLVEHIRALKNGQSANVPMYDFKTHSRTPVTQLYQPKRVIIVEGILIFTSPNLCDEMDMKVFVDADNDTRVVRRIQRDTVERGRTLESILTQYQTFVKPMHEEWVEPCKGRADIIVNSETGHSLDRAIELLANHMRIASGIIPMEDNDAMENGERQNKYPRH